MSEFSFIYSHFNQLTAKHGRTTLGIGDDGAISQLPPNCELVSCMDVLVAGRHFVHETCPHAIGYKAVAVNLSDLAAMGASPYGILLGLSLPKTMANDTFCRKFASGVADICGQFGVELIGGDTTGADTLTISVTALGFVPTHQAICRSGAKVGDVVCVSGQIGTASFGLGLLLDDLHGDGHIKADNAWQQIPDDVREALQYPVPQVALGQALRGYAHSMIDISDGLGQDLGHILTASGVGAKLDLDKIPCHLLINQLPFTQKYQHILNGGDDYQLCLTISPDKFDEFNALYPNLIYPIGEIIAGDSLLLSKNNQPVDFTIQGWQHF